MKRTHAVLALLLAATSARANINPFGDFQGRVQDGLLKPFALDLGGLLGSDSAHSGRVIGFPGFWAGPVMAFQTRPDANNLILRSAGVRAFGLPLIEVGVGLPFKVDVIAHGGGYDGAKIFGGGVRYGIYRTDLVDFFLPNVSVAAFGDKVDFSAFHAFHTGFDAAATWNLPIVKPFFVAGLDITKVTVDSASIPGVTGLSATARGSRFSAGLDVTPFPFTSVRGALTLRHNVPGADLGVGVRF